MIKNRNIPLKIISLFLVFLITLLSNTMVYGLVGSYTEKSDATGENKKQRQCGNENFTFVQIAGFLGTVTFSNYADASGFGAETYALNLKKSNLELMKKEVKKNGFNNFSKFDNLK